MEIIDDPCIPDRCSATKGHLQIHPRPVALCGFTPSSTASAYDRTGRNQASVKASYMEWPEIIPASGMVMFCKSAVFLAFFCIGQYQPVYRPVVGCGVTS